MERKLFPNEVSEWWSNVANREDMKKWKYCYEQHIVVDFLLETCSEWHSWVVSVEKG